MMAATVPEQAQENRDYVRRLLKKKQPRFAAALEVVVRELSESCPWCRRTITMRQQVASAGSTQKIVKGSITWQ